MGITVTSQLFRIVLAVLAIFFLLMFFVSIKGVVEEGFDKLMDAMFGVPTITIESETQFKSFLECMILSNTLDLRNEDERAVIEQMRFKGLDDTELEGCRIKRAITKANVKFGKDTVLGTGNFGGKKGAIELFQSVKVLTPAEFYDVLLIPGLKCKGRAKDIKRVYSVEDLYKIDKAWIVLQIENGEIAERSGIKFKCKTSSGIKEIEANPIKIKSGSKLRLEITDKQKVLQQLPIEHYAGWLISKIPYIGKLVAGKIFSRKSFYFFIVEGKLE